MEYTLRRIYTLLIVLASVQLAIGQPPPRPSGERPNGERARGPNAQGSNTWESFWQKLSNYDRNQDGTITEQELNDTRLGNLFARADANHDKQVTEAEWRAHFDRESKTLNDNQTPGGPGGLGGSNTGARGPGGPPPRRRNDEDNQPRPAQPPTTAPAIPQSKTSTNPQSERAASPTSSNHDSSSTRLWGAWRGDESSNVLTEGTLPIRWDTQENVAWWCDVPGYGWSSPIVVGDRIILTSAIDPEQTAPVLFGPGSGHYEPPDRLVRFDVLCYDLFTGKLLWRQTLAEKKPDFATHPTNTYATETAVSDGKLIFVRFGEIGLACYDLDGHLKWRQDIGPYRMQGGWGTSSNPVLTKQGVILQVDSETNSFVTLLSKEDGKPLWRVDRHERSAWSSPYLWRNSLREEVVLIGAKSIRSYDPQSGNELWSLGATGRTDASRRNDPAFEAGSCKASPTGNRELLLVGKGNRAKAGSSQFGPFWAVTPGGSGDINLAPESSNGRSTSFVKWYREDAGPVIASPLLVDGLVYIMPRNGSTFHCLNAEDGLPVYSQSLGREQYFFVTPWAAAGHIYASSGSGKTFVFKTGPKFELVATNDLDEHCYAAPALLNDALVFRTATKLYCIGQPPAGTGQKLGGEELAKHEPLVEPATDQRTSPAPSTNRRGRQGPSRLVEFALATEGLTAEQKTAIEEQVSIAKKREQDLVSLDNVPRASERISDDLRRGIEAVLSESQKKSLRTRLAEGSGDPGAANGGPITTLREQLAQVGLTAEQEFAVQTLVLELRDEIGQAVRDTTQSRASAIRTITENTKQKIVAILSDEQREKLKKLQRR